MITSAGQEVKDKRSSILEADLKKYLFDKNQITEYPRRLWFKGSRNR